MTMPTPDVQCPYCGSRSVQSTEPDNLEGVDAVSKTATCGDCGDQYVIEYEAAYVAYADDAQEWQRQSIRDEEDDETS